MRLFPTFYSSLLILPFVSYPSILSSPPLTIHLPSSIHLFFVNSSFLPQFLSFTQFIFSSSVPSFFLHSTFPPLHILPPFLFHPSIPPSSSLPPLSTFPMPSHTLYEHPRGINSYLVAREGGSGECVCVFVYIQEDPLMFVSV